MNSAYDDTTSDQKRISILVTKEIHKEIKLHALKADKSMKDYVLGLIMRNIGISKWIESNPIQLKANTLF